MKWLPIIRGLSPPYLLPIASQMLINELDSDTPGSDTAEFIELSDGGAGNTNLDGLVVVLFNGGDDLSYRAVDLDGQQTNGTGYFVIGNPAVTSADLIIPNGALQNGADAVALYAGSASDFPNGTALTNNNLLDALVYDTGNADDGGLLTLLLNGEPQVNESGRNNPTGDSNQRCPDSSGGQRRTSTYLQNLPTPGASNKCTYDAAPRVSSVTPQDGSNNVAVDSTITIVFNEAVSVANGWYEISCSSSGTHAAAISGGETSYTLNPNENFVAGESCTVTVFATKVNDRDSDDPPDLMVANYHWSFSTLELPIALHLVINEIDADTVGADQLEFIELYDGGDGITPLDGLVVVLYNGAGDLSYRSFDLAGWSTNSQGYFVLGNSALPEVDLVFSNALLQNGPDAVALYTGNGADFANGTAVTTNNLLDALVYDTADIDDIGLLPLLNAGQPQVDEAGRGDSEGHSNQRCPNGQGGQRMSSGFMQNAPTPGANNDCAVDEPPQVTEIWPTNGAVDVLQDANITISFSEPVSVQEPWFTINCEQSGQHTAQVIGGPQNYTLDPETNFGDQEVCTTTLLAARISDQDGLSDPLPSDYAWSFSTGIPSFGACGDPATPIHFIQGSGASSPLSGTQSIVIEGVVSADYQGQEKLGGFFLQQEPESMDNDPNTSEGIFVNDNDLGIDVNVSDVVRAQGNIAEIDSMTTISQLIELKQCGTVTSMTPTIVSLPVADTADWESVEGMLVQISQRLAATGSDALGSEGSVELALNWPTLLPHGIG